MSRKYEGLIVLNTKGAEGNIEELISSVAADLQAEGAQIAETNHIGRRKFAYNARHLESGFYISISFSSTPCAIEKIQNRLKLNTQVFLQHFQRTA